VKLTTLQAVCESVRYGFTASASDTNIGPKFLRITDIVPNQINWETVPYCQIDDKDKEKYMLEPGDIVVARTGATVGYAKLIREQVDSVFASYLVRFRVDRSIADPGFVGKIVESQAYKSFVRGHSGGAAQPNASAPILGSFPFVLPDRRSQTRIFEVASAYDDLIENNRRRIALLEQSARLLYGEWFVHMRFPGHEHVKVVDGVPEGWERTTLGDVAENHDRLRVPLSVLEREKRQGVYPYYGAASLLDHVDGYLFDGRYLLLGEDGTVVNSDGAPMLQLVEGKFWVNNHAHVLTGKKAGLEFLYCCLSSYKIQGHITGVAQPKITQANMNRIPLLLPSESVMSDFQSSVKASFDQRFVLERLNEKLRQARDLLLPRLMSGDLVV
jgi:type I restriction enzyme S subunit